MLGSAVLAQAQFTWSGADTTDGNVRTGANWVGNVAPTGSGTESISFDVLSGTQTNVLVPPFTAFTNIDFVSGARPQYKIFGTGTSPVLTLNGNITVGAGNAVEFKNSLDLFFAAGEHVVSVASGTSVKIEGVISGTGHLTKTGAGTAILTGSNTFAYSGVGFNNGVAVDGGTLELQGGSLNQPFQDIIVGSTPSATGTLLVDSGGTVTDKYGVAGNDNGSNGTITVTGSGSTWTNSQGMALGYLGTAYLNVLAGGTVTTTGSGSDHSYLGLQTGTAGTAVVDGTGSSWTTPNDQLIIGGGGTGDLTISNGGLVSDTMGKVGLSNGGVGTVIVDNGTWNNSNYLYVGLVGSGSLAISNGGQVTSPDTSIGNNAGGTGTIQIAGAGTQLTTTNTLYVGSAGNGVLDISASGRATSTTGSIGNNAGGLGTAQIDTGGTWYNSGSLIAGNATEGHLIVLSAGTVSAADLTVGALSGVFGYVDLENSGSLITTTGNMTVGLFGLGYFSVFSGATASTGGNLVVGANGGSTGQVSLTDAGSTFSVAGSAYVGNAGVGTLYAANGQMNVGAGSGSIYLGHSGGAGAIHIGYDLESYDVGTVINAAAITGESSSATVFLETQTTAGAPFYLTKNGLAGGGAVALNGSLSVQNSRGYNVLKAANTYTGDTTVTGGTLVFDGGSTSGSGTVSTQNGGQVIFQNGGSSYSFAGFIGSAGSGGASVAQGAGTTWQVGDELIVGAFGGQGSLNILNGAHVNSYRGSISYIGPATSYVTVDGAGSQWNNTNRIFVGSAGGNARLNVNNGGLVTSTTSAIGLDGGYGWATITGNGSSWSDTTSVAVGANAGGTGFLQLNEFGLLTIASGLGTLTLGSNTANGTLIIGDSESYAHGGILNAATVTTGTGTGAVQFDTASPASAPYYFTKDGTAGGTAVTITGTTSVQNVNGYTVLNGANTYTGGTTVSGGTLVVGSNSALGTGNVAVNGGTLRIGSGVTFANPLSFTTGVLGGSGTLGAAFTAGTGIELSPGNSPGTLTFASGLTLAGGGILNFEVQSAAGPAGVGYDLLSISGAPLDITATSGSPFTLKLISLDLAGAPGAVSDFSASNSYSWTIATSSLGITNFAANKFTIDTSAFSNSLGAFGNFSLAQSGNNLVLNFSPVPEPSTYALLLTGLGGAALAGWRRRRIQR